MIATQMPSGIPQHRLRLKIGAQVRNLSVEQSFCNGTQFTVESFGDDTPSHMTNVKWLLMNTHFWSSFSDFIICYLGLPYLYIPQLAGYGLGLVNSPALAIYSLVTVTAYSGLSVIAIYENRYFMLFGQKTWWRKYRKPYFIIVYIFVPFIFVPPYFNIPEQESARAKVLESIPCLPKYTLDDRKMFVLSLDFIVPVVSVTIGLLILAISFIIFLSLTFWNIWMGEAWAASRQTIMLQKAFTKGVTIQTLYEFFILFIPVVIVLAMIVFWYHDQVINNILFLILSLNGVGSTFIMIFVHKPYRTFTLSIFCYPCCPKLHKKVKDVTQMKTQLSAIA
ncbi:hypothetical protein CAEBREN_10823 [Caenorhabditis brenneri]|uniref:DNA helicase Pif1-like 2B domain-containing protein n=1 Tax=Caenorhabditis brenneri TaxID=135651 RepID=G0M8T6_CAEBE|nr:hypothetical protein CAEBREN_10823 [Caenorhabditis brenneri]